MWEKDCELISMILDQKIRNSKIYKSVLPKVLVFIVGTMMRSFIQELKSELVIYTQLSIERD